MGAWRFPFGTIICIYLSIKTIIELKLKQLYISYSFHTLIFRLILCSNNEKKCHISNYLY